MEKLTNTGANSQQLLAWLSVCLLAERSSHLHEVKLGVGTSPFSLGSKGNQLPRLLPAPWGGGVRRNTREATRIIQLVGPQSSQEPRIVPPGSPKGKSSLEMKNLDKRILRLLCEVSATLRSIMASPNQEELDLRSSLRL